MLEATIADPATEATVPPADVAPAAPAGGPLPWRLAPGKAEIVSGIDGIRATLAFTTGGPARAPDVSEQSRQRIDATVAAGLAGLPVVERFQRLHAQLGEAKRQQALAEAKLTELGGRRLGLEIEAGPDLAKRLVKLSSEEEVAKRRHDEATTHAQQLQGLHDAAQVEAEATLKDVVAKAVEAERQYLAEEQSRLRDELARAATPILTALASIATTSRGALSWASEAMDRNRPLLGKAAGER